VQEQSIWSTKNGIAFLWDPVATLERCRLPPLLFFYFFHQLSALNCFHLKEPDYNYKGYQTVGTPQIRKK